MPRCLFGGDTETLAALINYFFRAELRSPLPKCASAPPSLIKGKTYEKQREPGKQVEAVMDPRCEKASASPSPCTPQPPLAMPRFNRWLGWKPKFHVPQWGFFFWFLLNYLFGFPLEPSNRKCSLHLAHASTVLRVRTEDGAGIQNQ